VSEIKARAIATIINVADASPLDQLMQMTELDVMRHAMTIEALAGRWLCGACSGSLVP
jgi:hypothetical protein